MQYGDVQVWTGVLVSTAHKRMAGLLFIPDYYWKVIAYKKNGTPTQEAWLGPNKPTNTSTDPTAIATTVADLKAGDPCNITPISNLTFDSFEENDPFHTNPSGSPLLRPLGAHTPLPTSSPTFFHTYANASRSAAVFGFATAKYRR